MISRIKETGFALPTILITSVVLIIVLLAAVQTIQGVNVALDDRYYDNLAREAAESGAVMARACLQQNNAVGWSTASPLHPNTGCSGGAPCTTGSNCYVLSQSNVNSTFTVGTPQHLANGQYSIAVSATVGLTRANGIIWKTYTSNVTALTNLAPSMRAISPGSDHVCAITVDGSMYCWGSGGSGQLGNGATSNSTTPVQVSTSGVAASAIASGDSHSCAIASTGLPYCWGAGSNGQLGNGATTNKTTPTAVTMSGALSGKTAKAISANVNSTCMISSDNLPYCWGAGSNGQLGNGSTSNTSTPTAVTMSGALSGKTVKSISAGGTHTCVIASDDLPYCWGENNFGQLGNGSTTDSSVPVAVSMTGALAGKTAKVISAGGSHTCMIASDNLPYCWGPGSAGSLGNGSSSNSSTPTAVTMTGALAGKTVRYIQSGNMYTCAVASDGWPYCWGTNTNGKLGDGTSNNSLTPVAVATSGALGNMTSKTINIEDSTSCVIASNNLPYCWGAGNNGQLGNGTTAASATTPVAVTASSFPNSLTDSLTFY